jgi:ABC-type Fe3+/spermidine/putrescine transport system ATPase subunit
LGRNNLLRVMRLSQNKTPVAEFKTLDGGHVLRVPVTHENVAPLNQPCFLAIRPEHLRLLPAEQQLENSLAGEIREINFTGATSTIRIDANGLGLEALVLQPNGLAVGSRCVVQLPAEHLSLLKNE